MFDDYHRVNGDLGRIVVDILATVLVFVGLTGGFYLLMDSLTRIG